MLAGEAFRTAGYCNAIQAGVSASFIEATERSSKLVLGTLPAMLLPSNEFAYMQTHPTACFVRYTRPGLSTCHFKNYELCGNDFLVWHPGQRLVLW